MKIEKSKGVVTQMLIRRPVTEVFEAFIDPGITKNFWFSKASGPLEAGKTLTWEWEVYNVTSNIFVKEILQDAKIVIEWGDPITTVEFHFQPLSVDTTYVVIENYGFLQTGTELIRQINDSTGGFTTVLDGLKAYMEHGILLNLIADKFPRDHRHDSTDIL